MILAIYGMTLNNCTPALHIFSVLQGFNLAVNNEIAIHKIQ